MAENKEAVLQILRTHMVELEKYIDELFHLTKCVNDRDIFLTLNRIVLSTAQELRDNEDGALEVTNRLATIVVALVLYDRLGGQWSKLQDRLHNLSETQDVAGTT